MQKWEYAWIKQMRGYGGTLFGATSDKWNFDTSTMSSNILKYYAEKRNIFDVANMMGNDGWELINMIPQSGIGGAESSGFTSDLVWVFKRPKFLMISLFKVCYSANELSEINLEICAETKPRKRFLMAAASPSVIATKGKTGQLVVRRRSKAAYANMRMVTCPCLEDVP